MPLRQIADLPVQNYIGRILTGDFSDALKRQLSGWIASFDGFDRVGCPSIPYICGWHENDAVIWYEFVGRRLVDFLRCRPRDTARAFRNSVIERRRFIQSRKKNVIQEEIITRDEIADERKTLRLAVEEAGHVEAIYKCAPETDQIHWFKDIASLYYYKEDDINLSIGNLTEISKEMEIEETLRRTEEALRQSEEKYRHQAIHDNLTGLYNTRYLYGSLNRLIRERTIAHAPFSIIFFDIDDFKTVVDRHGHLHASQTIQEVAGTIQDTITSPAFAVAYAGDEFLVVLPENDKNGAMEKAREIRDNIKQAEYLSSRGLSIKIEASFGVSTFPIDAKDMTELLGLADRAMFSVKALGKGDVAHINDMGKP